MASADRWRLFAAMLATLAVCAPVAALPALSASPATVERPTAEVRLASGDTPLGTPRAGSAQVVPGSPDTLLPDAASPTEVPVGEGLARLVGAMGLIVFAAAVGFWVWRRYRLHVRGPHDEIEYYGEP